MSRLASLHGPSSPSPSPVPAPSSSSPTPSRRTPTSKRTGNRASPAPDSPQSAQADAQPQPQSQSQPRELPFHRKFRGILREVAGVVAAWDELVLGEGLRAVKGVVDNGTELDNLLASTTEHRSVVATPKVRAINAHLHTLDGVLAKLETLFRALVLHLNALESLILAASARSALFLFAPIWLTWTPQHFLSALSPLAVRYHRALLAFREGVEKLRDPAAEWGELREVVRGWAAQGELRGEADGIGGMEWRELEEVWRVEVGGWGNG